jgi:ABC-type branched-subunit amino acid transport system permease subunit
VPYGPLIGALIVKLAPELLASVERYQSIIMGIVFALVIVLLPDGLGASMERLFQKGAPETRKVKESA